MNKKTVRYSDIGQPRVGWRASLIAIDHPEAPNGEWIRTSPVVAIGYIKGGPMVETHHTLYVPGFVETDSPVGMTPGVPHAHSA